MSDYPSDSLYAGSSLPRGQNLWSSDHSTRLQVQDDGNIVIYRGAALWASNTVGMRIARLKMREDGNLVGEAEDGTALWETRTSRPGAYAILQTDSNLVVYVGGQAPNDGGIGSEWNSGTGGGHGFLADVGRAVKTAAQTTVQVGDVLGFPGLHLTAAALTGENAIDALKADVATFKKDGELAKMVSSGDYEGAWKAVTKNGTIFDKDIPAPPGHSYTPDAIAKATYAPPPPPPPPKKIIGGMGVMVDPYVLSPALFFATGQVIPPNDPRLMPAVASARLIQVDPARWAKLTALQQNMVRVTGFKLPPPPKHKTALIVGAIALVAAVIYNRSK